MKFSKQTVEHTLNGLEQSGWQKLSHSEYPIVVKSDVHSLEDLQNLEIKASASGNKYQLKQLATVGLKEDYEYISRYNGIRTVIVSASPQSGYTAINLTNQLMANLKTIDLGNVTLTDKGDGDQMYSFCASSL